MKNNNYHTTVLLKEAVDALRIDTGERYIDATLGGGGHSSEILLRGGIVLAIDKDNDAIDEGKKRFKNELNITLVKGDFKDIKKIAQNNGFNNCAGILFDLGTSVHQFKAGERGFSFSGHNILDMRMDQDAKSSAREIINNWSKTDLIEIIERYGEESEAVEIVNEIIERRKKKEIVFTDELAELISKVKKRNDGGIHAATKTFQAIRIAVNNEIEILSLAVKDSVDLLEPGGRIVVISFHSLEDRVVKKTFLELEKNGKGAIIVKKPIRPKNAELAVNKKARSAKMRVFEKN